MGGMFVSSVRSLFPGAMGPDGFISCFDHLLPERDLRRMIVLKGGPGVGKSTFMRRVHAALCPDGQPSTLYFCSGDPDSLDAVAVPHLGLLLLDGTAPHVVDPVYPGARDSIVNLGECLDEAAMRPRLPQLRAALRLHWLFPPVRGPAADFFGDARRFERIRQRFLLRPRGHSAMLTLSYTESYTERSPS